ncbi:FAD-dependent monooxygenase [Actinomycetes bacterium KLBMP 9797]
MTTSAVRRVLIAGGGIGGLTTAVALRKAGIKATIFERAPALRASGSGLHLWTNAMLALADLGLADAVCEVGPVHEHCDFRSWRGDVLATWPIGQFIERHGQATVAIGRRELMAILADALGDQELHLGAEVVGYEQDAHGVTALFADGRRERGSVLVAADGIHSVLRRQMLGDDPPRFNGYVAWRAAIDFEHDLVPYGSFCSMYGHGKRFVYYDIARGRLHWMSVTNAPPGGVDAGGVRDMLLERHKGWMEPIAEILRATDESKIIRSDILDRKPDKQWIDGRVVLLGDSAHPMSFNTGQGACQAIEDALVLAQSLAARSDTPAALREYQTQRQPRTAASQRASWFLGRLGALSNPVAVAMRHRLIKAYWERGVFKRLDKDMATGARWRPLPAHQSSV